MLFQDIVLEEMEHDDHQEMLTQDSEFGEMIDTVMDESVDIFNDDIKLKED